MSGILYPNVPNLPGVPALLRLAIASVLPLPVLAVADALGLPGLLTGPQWGIFDSGGNPVLTVDSVADVDVARDANISDFPVEAGGFATYNKVIRPRGTKTTVMVGGSDAARSSFLMTLDAVWQSLSLYNVVTPEYVYTNANIVHYDYRRTARNGATLLRVNVWLEEVRQIAQATYASTASPNAATDATGGYVQPGQIKVEQLPPIQATGIH